MRPGASRLTAPAVSCDVANEMGRKPIGKSAMTNAERQRRRYARLRPGYQLTRLKTAFINAEEATRAAFLDWLRKRRFMK
jgi:hypothetical protein